MATMVHSERCTHAHAKEEHPISAYIADTQVEYPSYQVLEDFEVSLEEDPGSPGPRW